MKAITTTMYVCGGLMIAAAVLGAVDYSSASRKGTIDKLYKEERTEVKAPPAPKEIELEDYSRAAIEKPVETDEIKTSTKTVAKSAVAKASKPVAKNRKKITFKEFSRKAIIPAEEMVLPDSVIAKE